MYMICLTTLLDTQTHYQAENLYKFLSHGQCFFFFNELTYRKKSPAEQVFVR